MTTRGILPTVDQVLTLLFSLWGYTSPSWRGYPSPSQGYPSPGWVVSQSWLGSTPLTVRGHPCPGWGTPVLEYPSGWNWSTPPWLGLVYPWERTWDQRPGKEPGTGVPTQKGPGTIDLRKNMGLGYYPLLTDRHLWKQYLPHPSDAGGNEIKMVKFLQSFLQYGLFHQGNIYLHIYISPKHIMCAVNKIMFWWNFLKNKKL